MENTEQNTQTVKSKKQENIHIILSESYLTYIIFFVPAMLLDYLFPVRDFINQYLINVGWVFLLTAPVLIYWAQTTSAQIKKAYEKGTPVTPSFFMHGPYRFTRRPTHLGISILFIGFALIVQSPFALIAGLIAHLITQFSFIKREECVLFAKYGEPYRVYCTKVGRWL